MHINKFITTIKLFVKNILIHWFAVIKQLYSEKWLALSFYNQYKSPSILYIFFYAYSCYSGTFVLSEVEMFQDYFISNIPTDK